MLVVHHLTGCSSGWSQTHTVDGIVQPGLQQLQQHLAGNSVAFGSFLVGLGKLALQHTISVLGLLLFFQLHAIF